MWTDTEISWSDFWALQIKNTMPHFWVMSSFPVAPNHPQLATIHWMSVRKTSISLGFILTNTLFKLNLLWLFHWVNTYDVKKINVISRRSCGFGNAKVVFTASSHFHFIYFFKWKIQGWKKLCLFIGYCQSPSSAASLEGEVSLNL